MKKGMKYRWLFIFVLAVSQLWGQGKGAGIQWMSWEEAQTRQQQEKRPIFLDVYTNWCSWCARMDETTFKEGAIAKYINEKFYPVRFNAEKKESIDFRNQAYGTVRIGKKEYHKLAAEWLGGRMSFPTLVFLDDESNLIQAIPGYRSAKELEVIATYFGSGEFRNTPWSVYEKNYQPTLVTD